MSRNPKLFLIAMYSEVKEIRQSCKDQSVICLSS